MTERGVGREHRAGTFLLRQGDHGGFVLALLSGRVGVFAGAADGSEVLLSLRAAGDLVGEMALKAGSHRTATVCALDRCRVRVIGEAEFNDFLSSWAAHEELNDYLVAKLSETVPYQVQQAHFTAEQRVCRLLWEVAALAEPGRTRIPFSQESLARALGLARSTVAEQIRVLRAEGVLGPGPRLGITDERALAGRAGVAVR
ncbi:hypothetical protein GCM10027174_04290 [Salinifilum aidingensis]